MIKKFDTRENIIAWQRFLNTQGESLQTDGKWGPMTKAATGRFQFKRNLTPDGIVGQDTLSAAMQAGFEGFGVGVGLLDSSVLICISAGHTNTPGRDQGVIANGLVEGKEAVVVRDHVATLVRKKDLTVIEDGADGVNDPLSKAIVIAKHSDLAVEFHLNAAPNPAARGVEVLSLPKNRAKAQIIAGAISKALGIPLRGDKGWKSDTEGQHSRLAFCREGGGLVVELFFVTNPAEVASYEENFEALVVALADAIAEAVKV